MQKGLTVKTPLSRIGDLVSREAAHCPETPTQPRPTAHKTRNQWHSQPPDSRRAPARPQSSEETLVHRRASEALEEEPTLEQVGATRRPETVVSPM
ncbi:SSU ribosomal protein S12E [Giardia duodenalis]|uniref:SSU ribosomal protein S12E n=1 Tax=Giardia intestinalis TaxID=5741 RepID=V6TU28_GIAIN|nr:SSU ribosomal protein S12E [Giardia intestinalis]